MYKSRRKCMLTIYVGVKTWTMRYPNVNLNSISLYKGVFIQPLEDKFFMLIKSFCLTLQPRLTRHPAWVNGSQTNVGNNKVSELQMTWEDGRSVPLDWFRDMMYLIRMRRTLVSIIFYMTCKEREMTPFNGLYHWLSVLFFHYSSSEWTSTVKENSMWVYQTISCLLSSDLCFCSNLSKTIIITSALHSSINILLLL